ncbi:MAG TPA: hypothetical protein VEL05_11615 [Candidatus Acidoferrum sp.]|nr:hypothetical protein [Candidatus Acidoferrum sp.]
MEEEPTCGKGLAGNAAIPAKLGQLIGSMARVLEVHMQALDPADPNARLERDAYANLARDQRDIAARLRATSAEMAGYRDLPMGRHDPAAMAGPGPHEVFEQYVRAETELLALLEESARRDQEMLAAMRGR